MLSVLTVFLLLPSWSSAQTYVNPAASGNNDGTSWADAYIDLQNALDNTTSGEIWVVGGTYISPGNSPENSRFVVSNSVAILGGFAGTETDRAERNPAMNVTTLTGDKQGDDTPGSFDMGKDDNAYHIVYVDSLITDGVLIDGFTISGAFTSTDDSTQATYFTEGGGLYTFSPVIVNNCTFTENFALNGAGYYLDGIATAGSQFTDCTFSNSLAAESGAAGFLLGTTNITFTGNTIMDNSSIGGGAITNVVGANVLIDSTLFSGNITAEGVGGAIVNFDCSTVIRNSTFDKNVATTGDGGAIYAQANNFRGGPLLGIVNSTFTENEATMGQGGAIYNVQSDFTVITQCAFSDNISGDRGAVAIVDNDSSLVSNCTFTDNLAANGGAMYILFTDNFFLESNVFDGNEASSFGGGAILSLFGSHIATDCSFSNNAAPENGGACYNGLVSFRQYVNCTWSGNEAAFGGGVADLEAETSYTGCRFESNIAGTSGGAQLGAFLQITDFTDCVFDGNEGRFGGAAQVQNDSSELYITNCSFNENSTELASGALSLSGGVKVEIIGSDFTSNATGGFGGAISGSEDSLDLAELTLDRCNFTLNNAVGQGGAVNLGNFSANITNTIFAFNTADLEDDGTEPTGRGGAISNNASKYTRDAGGITGEVVSNLADINLMNCSFVNNDGDLAGSISQWEESDTTNGRAVLTMQNTYFFYNPDDFIAPNYAIEAGDPEVISNGGNLSSDDSMDPYLTMGSDLTSTDPMLLDPDNEDFTPMVNSPLIDAGIADGAPDVDIFGLARPQGDGYDIGAIEFDITSSTEEIVSGKALKISPNPVANQTLLSLDNDWSGDLQLNVVNSIGQLVKTINLEKPAGAFNYELNASDLERGVYQLTISDGKEMIVKPIVKL